MFVSISGHRPYPPTFPKNARDCIFPDDAASDRFQFLYITAKQKRNIPMTAKKNKKDAPHVMPGPDQRLTTADVAHHLQVKPKLVRQWLLSGQLRGIRMKKEWRITWAALDDFNASWNRR
jgi:hypothetical protein